MKRNFSDYLIAFAVLLCSAVLLGALTFALSGYRLSERGRTLQIDFPDITGIRRHSEVRYAGAPAGTVVEFRHLTADERKNSSDPRNAVRIIVELADDVPELPSDIKVTLTSETMLSEKFVALSAGSPDVAKLANGAVLQGKLGGSLDEVFASVGPALESVKTIVASLEPVIQKTGETLDSIKGGVNDALPRISSVADSAKTMAESADALLKRTDKLVANSEGDIKKNLVELRESLDGVQKVLGNADKMVNSADKMVNRTDRELAGRMTELSVILQNLKVVSTHAKAVTETLGEKPSRLIWGSKRNKLASEEEILRSSKPVPAATRENREVRRPRTLSGR